MKRLVLFLIVFIAILAVFSAFFWLYEVKFMVGRASISANSFSIDNSYIFSTPLRAKANSQEKIRVTVFVLNNQGLGVSGKNVFVGMDSNLTIETIQGLTDSYGKAYFDISSSKASEYYLDIKVDGTSLKQKAHLIYY